MSKNVKWLLLAAGVFLLARKRGPRGTVTVGPVRIIKTPEDGA